VLFAAQPIAGTSPELIGALADVYIQAGDPYRALNLIRGVMASAPNDVGTLMQFASILQSTHQDSELGIIMRRLSAMQLTPSQREQFTRLNLGIVVAQADTVRKRGDLAGAYDVLAPWLAAMPDAPQLQSMLGRLYTSADEPDEALKCYQLALSKQPDDRGMQIETIYAASKAKDFSYGEQIATQALRVAPDDPDLLAATGRLYRAEGRLSLAAEYLRRSLLISTQPAGASLNSSRVPNTWQSAFAGMGSATQPFANPFAGKVAVDVPASPSPLTITP
jgi:cellulose synthase operon protein C